MTAGSLPTEVRRNWHDAFTPADLEALREMIPAAIQAAQARTGRANTEYADPEGELDVYGVGMSKAAPKELRAVLRSLSNYHEVTIPKTSRRLMFVGNTLIFPIRVGEKMRRNKTRLWLRSFSESRQKYLGENSTTRRAPQDTPLFDVADTSTQNVDESGVLDALRHVEVSSDRTELFVVFFSSSPLGVGQIMWAPARLDGRHLHFVEPEALTYRKNARNERPVLKPRQAAGFAASERPRTDVKRREKPTPTVGPGQ